MTQAEYARYAGVTQQYISTLVRTGRIPLAADGSIDPQAADAARARMISELNGVTVPFGPTSATVTTKSVSG